MPKRTTGFSTRAIHAGQGPDPATGAVVVPIYQTATFAQEALGHNKGYEYARVSNPTRTALETNLAALEGGAAALAFASGMAATNAVLTLLSAGDHVLCQDHLYGGTVRLFNQILRRFGVEFTYVDASRVENLEAAVRPNTRLLFLETPTNPLMRLIDLRACTSWAHKHRLTVAVDNTFMTPYFQRPLELGADIVIHSTTKYLNGHSDGIGGAVIAKDAETAARVKFIQKAAGAILAPFECWLLLRGVKTLAVRMRQHEANAMEVARWLVKQRKVGAVHYPGLAGQSEYERAQHKLARRQMSGFGGMLSFDLGSRTRVARFVKRLRVCALGESLGGVESLIAHPATMSHAGISAGERAAMEIGDGLLRLSVGIEDCDDLISDLDQALRAV
jgi:cystathionine beta-lyase/cystathionine gamma-synthase